MIILEISVRKVINTIALKLRETTEAFLQKNVFSKSFFRQFTASIYVQNNFKILMKEFSFKVASLF